jgi:hypothetical protein
MSGSLLIRYDLRIKTMFGSSLHPVVFCVVLLFCVPYVTSFSGLSIFDCPLGNPKRLFTFDEMRMMMMIFFVLDQHG